ncbi:MAG: acetyl-CoA C-acyltransferase [Deltaproteobacteria bacterium]|nr:MAG: acetyl-CoA C-acyltransferase [Deltaproteobacteria bacterium]
MIKLEDCVIVSGVRIPIGRFGGALRDLKVYDLGGAAIKAAVEKAGITPDMVDEVIMSHTRQDGTGTNPARTALLKAGLPIPTAAHTVNKVCAAGIKAVSLATQAIRVGDAEIIVVGGMESMSNIPHLLRGARWQGFRLTDIKIEDAFLYLICPFCGLSPGLIAEQSAQKYKLNREEQDKIGYESHRRAVQAWEDGVFDKEVVPITIPATKKKPEWVFEKDECLRPDVSLEKMQKLPPAFKKDGTVTAGQSSGITDGAGAMVMMTRQKAAELGLKPMAHVVDYMFYGVDPGYFPEGPSVTIPRHLKKVGLSIDDITAFEINEAFAVVNCICINEAGIPWEKTNLHGGGISLGHPTGYTGARLTLHLANILKPGEYGLAAACGGGGLTGSIIIQGE